MKKNGPEIIAELKGLSNEKTKRIYQKQGIQEAIIGVNKGPLRQLATQLAPDQPLGNELWKSGIYEARVMAIMLFEPKKMTINEVETLLQQTESVSLIDELSFTLFEEIPDPKHFLDQWFTHPDLKLQRSAWNMATVLSHRKKMADTELDNLIKIIEDQLASAQPIVQYAMNRALVEIGVTYGAYTQRCLDIGARLGIYKEVMVAKGCTSPYAPDWINAVLRRKS